MRGGGSSSKRPIGGERRCDVVGALRRNADGARDVGDRLGRQAVLLARDRHRDDAAREPGEIAQEALAILGRQHADDQHQRARHALLEIGERIGDGAAAVGIVAAVEPQFAARGASAASRPCDRRCMRAGQSALAMPVSNAAGGSSERRPTARKAAMATPAFSNWWRP